MKLFSGMKRGFDDHGGRDDSRHERRDDFIADDGRSMYTAGGRCCPFSIDFLENNIFVEKM